MTEQSYQSSYSPDEIQSMLALATTGEPEADDRATDFSQLTPREIVAAIGAVRQATARAEHAYLGAYRGEPVEVSDTDRRLADYHADVDSLLSRTPELIGPEKTRDVFTMLSSSNSPDDRREAATFIGTLTRSDHDFGLRMWRNLVRDPVIQVAKAAGLSAGQYEHNDAAGLVNAIARDGLTLHDWMELTNMYIGRLEEALGDTGQSI